MERKEVNTAQKRKPCRHDGPAQKQRKIGHRRICRTTQETFTFPPGRIVTDPIGFRPLAYSVIESSVEKALLSRDWRKAARLLQAVFNYSFLENQSPNKFILEERKFKRYFTALQWLLEVLYHLPGGDALVKSLLDVGMCEKRFLNQTLVSQTECRLLRSFILCCEGKLQDAGACVLVDQKQINLFNTLSRTVNDGQCAHHTFYARGAIAYARWASKIREIGGTEGKEVNPSGTSPVDFKECAWVSSNMECSGLANELRGQLEKAKDQISLSSMDSFYKLAHIYTVQGEWDAAVAVGNEACRNRPLDADSHTLSACLSLGCPQTSQTKTLEAACKSLVEVLKCDPACKSAAHTLAEFSTKPDWSVKAMVVEGLLYHLDVCPPCFQNRNRPQMHTTPHNGRESWKSLAETLMEFALPVSDTTLNLIRIEQWERVQTVLCARGKWWKKFMFKVRKPFTFPVDLESRENAGFLADVGMCSVFLLGKDNGYCREVCELLVREGWPDEVERIELAKKNFEMEVVAVVMS